MDKYGVVTEIEKTSTERSGRDVCPRCHTALETVGANTLWCPKCGTEPFEEPMVLPEGM